MLFPRWLVEQAALGVHKIMSYSDDAGSAFIFGSLVGDKMDVLFDGAVLSSPSVYFLPSFLLQRLSSAVLHQSDGAYPYSGGFSRKPWT